MKKIVPANVLQKTIFWIVMFIYLLSTYWFKQHDKLFVVQYIAFKVFLQFLFSIFTFYLLIPYFLNKKRIILFVLGALMVIYLLRFFYIVVIINYFQISFPEIYKMRPPFLLWDRLLSLVSFINNIMWLVFPSIILIAIKYYQDQKDIIALKEQKKTTELNLLKHQLNPHFLFNTLNNLYALALKKSDKTPEVIAKLSEILDYILYQCKDKYVPIAKEIDLLENYIALEKVRYGNRVRVIFEKNSNQNVKIAPLILLTFVENAFKHGISQELNKGIIELDLSATTKEIIFKLKNTKPKSHQRKEDVEKHSIGMKNTQKQLNLLYPNNGYSLKINNEELSYYLELKLTVYEKV